MNAFLRYVTATRPSMGAQRHSISLNHGTQSPAADFGQITHLVIEPENVLYDATLWPRWLWQLLSHMGVAAPFQEFFASWHERFRKEVDLGQREYWDAFHDFLLEAGLSEGQIAEVLAAGVPRKQRFESERRCLPGVSETLRVLGGRGISLYVLANTPRASDGVLRELDSIGLQGVFQGGVTSRELRAVMPSPKSYRRALERFGSSPSQTLFVSSSPRLLKGAAKCGMLAIAFNEDCPSAAAFSLERFSDLAAWVQPFRGAKAAG
jgi:FMN phosphatase YigB (HAD superfamily)